MFDYAETIVRRSRLIMPANNQRFIEKAFLRNADAIVLDLEDSIPETEKRNTREKIKELIPTVAKGGSDVIVRVNQNNELLKEDIESSVWPELTSIYLPKVESPEEITYVETILSELEENRSIPRGQIKISIAIETVRGYRNVSRISQASSRIDSLTLGMEDFSNDSGISISEDTYHAMLIPRMDVLFTARASRQIPLGLMGSIADFNDLKEVERNALLASRHGFLGASCIHPGNVEILNSCFSPSLEEREYAEKVIYNFERSAQEGKAAIVLEGKMIDTPHYEQAKKLLKRVDRINDFEQKKQKARKSAMKIGG